MSRSRKKHGVVKDNGLLKRADYNRIFRRVNKQRVKQGQEPLLMKELIDSYDVHDWISVWSGDIIERRHFNQRLHQFYKSFKDYKRQYFKK